MKTFISALLVLCVQSSLFAQEHQISLRLFSFTDYRTSSSSKTNIDAARNTKFYNTLPVLGYQHICKNNTIYSIEYGYTRRRSKSNMHQNESSSIYFHESKNLSSSSTHALRFGVGKQNVWNKFQLSSMIYFPFQYTSNNKYESSSAFFSSTTNSNIYNKLTVKQPNMITAGIYLAQGLHYLLCKQFLVGIELNLGLRSQIQKGIYTQKSTSDNGTTISEQETSEKYSLTYSSLDFLPALSLKYQFGKR